MPPMLLRRPILALALLLPGALLNLAGGARRVFAERRLLDRGYYPDAYSPAGAVRRLVPVEAPLAVVVYPDRSRDLDYDVWFDYRLKWLLYPRRFDLYREDERGEMRYRSGYVRGEAQFRPGSPFAEHPYVLFFRATQPPTWDERAGEVLARGKSWALTRVRRP